MSPRPAAALRGGDQDLRAHLIATAAAVIARRGTAGLSVRDIAREAQVADGVLYNYFSGKDDLIAHGLRAHVHATLEAGGPPPEPGSGEVRDNLVTLFTRAVTLLGRLLPAFAGTVGQTGVLTRFHDLMMAHSGERTMQALGTGGAGLPQLFAAYLDGERKLGRLAADADIEAATTLLIGAAHDLVLPRVFFGAFGGLEDPADVALPPGHADRIVRTLLGGLRGNIGS